MAIRTQTFACSVALVVVICYLLTHHYDNYLHDQWCGTVSVHVLVQQEFYCQTLLYGKKDAYCE